MPRITGTAPSFQKTFVAAEALAAHRLVIQSSTDGQVEYPAGADDTQVLGVTMHAAAAGADVDVIIFGPALLTVDGNASAISVGDWLVSHSADGYGAKRALSDGTTFREFIGRALEASTADGDEISIFFNPFVSATA